MRLRPRSATMRASSWLPGPSSLTRARPQATPPSPSSSRPSPGPCSPQSLSPSALLQPPAPLRPGAAKRRRSRRRAAARLPALGHSRRIHPVQLPRLHLYRPLSVASRQRSLHLQRRARLRERLRSSPTPASATRTSTRSAPWDRYGAALSRTRAKSSLLTATRSPDTTFRLAANISPATTSNTTTVSMATAALIGAPTPHRSTAT